VRVVTRLEFQFAVPGAPSPGNSVVSLLRGGVSEIMAPFLCSKVGQVQRSNASPGNESASRREKRNFGTLEETLGMVTL
jgi:hypothetical protein